MMRRPRLVLLLCITGSLWVACNHDSKRNNPLDPTLTPPVELLSSSVQDGFVSLRWSAYAGDAPLSTYRILRQVVGTDTSVTLVELTDRLDTAFVDRNVATGAQLRYWIEVVNRSGLTRASNELVIHPEPPMPSIAVAFDSQVEVAEIRWTTAASGFVEYELRRQESGSNRVQIVYETESLSDTLFLDDQIEPGVSYTYRLIVRYDSGDVIGESTGSYHRFLETFRLPETGTIIALHVDDDDRVYALYETTSDVVVADLSATELLRLRRSTLADSLDAADLVVRDGNIHLLGGQRKVRGWNFAGAGRVVSYDASGAEKSRWPADATLSGLTSMGDTEDGDLLVSRVHDADLNGRTILYHLTPEGGVLDSVMISKPLWRGLTISGSWGSGVFGGQPQSAAGDEFAWGVRQFRIDSGSLRFGLIARGDPYFIFQTDGSGAFPDQDIDGLASDVAWTPDGLLLVAHGDRTTINSTTWGGGALVARDTPRIRAFHDGVEIARWGDHEIGPGRLINPVAVATDSHGYVYVADRINEVDSVVRVYAPVDVSP